MGFISKLNIFGKHKKIERTIAVFFACFIPLLLMMCISVYNKFGLDRREMSANAVYTTSVTLSRTGQQGEVVGVYTNKAKTRGMVLIKMSDTDKLSTNAEDYKVFTTAVDLDRKEEKLKSKPEGSIYVLGSSGYIGLYFVDNAGFQSQIFKSTLRLDKEFTTVTKNNVSSQTSSKSYSEHDQMDVYFNLGASKAEDLKALDKKVFSAQDLYIEAVGKADDDKQRKLLADDLAKMSKLKLQIEEQRNRLESLTADGVKVVVPELPKEMKSDSFSGSGDNVKMSTDYVYSNGINVDWRKLKLEDGYFDAINNLTINPDGLSLSRWLVQLNDRSADDEVTTYEVEWMMEDGTTLEQFASELGSSNAAVSELNKQTSSYVSLVSEYLALKSQYQTQDLVDLISSDLALQTATSGVDHASKDHFFTY